MEPVAVPACARAPALSSWPHMHAHALPWPTAAPSSPHPRSAWSSPCSGTCMCQPTTSMGGTGQSPRQRPWPLPIRPQLTRRKAGQRRHLQKPGDPGLLIHRQRSNRSSLCSSSSSSSSSSTRRKRHTSRQWWLLRRTVTQRCTVWGMQPLQHRERPPVRRVLELQVRTTPAAACAHLSDWPSRQAPFCRLLAQRGSTNTQCTHGPNHRSGLCAGTRGGGTHGARSTGPRHGAAERRTVAEAGAACLHVFKPHILGVYNRLLSFLSTRTCSRPRQSCLYIKHGAPRGQFALGEHK